MYERPITSLNINNATDSTIDVGCVLWDVGTEASYVVYTNISFYKIK